MNVNAPNIADVVAHHHGRRALVPYFIGDGPVGAAKAVEAQVADVGGDAEGLKGDGKPVVMGSPTLIDPREGVFGINQQQHIVASRNGLDGGHRLWPAFEKTVDTSFTPGEFDPIAVDRIPGEAGDVLIAHPAIECQEDGGLEIPGGLPQQLVNLGGFVFQGTALCLGYAEFGLTWWLQVRPEVDRAGDDAAGNGPFEDPFYDVDQLLSPGRAVFGNGAGEGTELPGPHPCGQNRLPQDVDEPLAGVRIVADNPVADGADVGGGLLNGDAAVKQLSYGELGPDLGGLTQLFEPILEDLIGDRTGWGGDVAANPPENADDAPIPTALSPGQSVLWTTLGHNSSPLGASLGALKESPEDTERLSTIRDGLQIRYSSVRIRPRPLSEIQLSFASKAAYISFFGGYPASPVSVQKCIKSPANARLSLGALLGASIPTPGYSQTAPATAAPSTVNPHPGQRFLNLAASGALSPPSTPDAVANPVADRRTTRGAKPSQRRLATLSSPAGGVA